MDYTFAPLTQYLASELNATYRRHNVQRMEIAHLASAISRYERIIRLQERRIMEQENELQFNHARENATIRYTRWLERTYRSHMGRPIPKSFIRALYHGNSRLTMEHNGQEYTTTDLEHWHPVVDLTTTDEEQGNEEHLLEVED